MTATPSNSKETVSMQEAQAILKLSRTAIYNRINKGELSPLPKSPAHKKRTVTEFYRSDIEKLLNS